MNATTHTTDVSQVQRDRDYAAQTARLEALQVQTPPLKCPVGSTFILADATVSVTFTVLSESNVKIAYKSLPLSAEEWTQRNRYHRHLPKDATKSLRIARKEYGRLLAEGYRPW